MGLICQISQKLSVEKAHSVGADNCAFFQFFLYKIQLIEVEVFGLGQFLNLSMLPEWLAPFCATLVIINTEYTTFVQSSNLDFLS